MMCTRQNVVQVKLNVVQM